MLSAGCSSVPGKLDKATKIAQTGPLSHKYIQASPFVLTSWQRLTAPNSPIHIYIEGDGLAWLSRSTPSNNPTPKNPIGLTLAAADPTPNIVYIARPCQYTPADITNNHCSRDYWMGKRFAKEVINSYHTALNQLSARHNGTQFHLVGYSGGANIAGLLAAERHDVLSLRTVAGNVDNDFFTSFHKVSPMPLSLNMADQAETRLSTLPQYHFIGEKDKFVPFAIFKNYEQKLSSSSCLQSNIVNGTTHSQGWAERWISLLNKIPRCQ